METHKIFCKTIPVGAYSSGNRIVSPPFRSPYGQLKTLSHEGAHVVFNNAYFVEQGIVTPHEARIKDYECFSDAQKSWLRDLFSTKQSDLNDGWQQELTEIIWKLLQLSTKNQFDPGVIDLNVMESQEAFLAHAATVNFSRSGITQVEGGFEIRPVKEGYQREVPAHYFERIIEAMMLRIIAPTILPIRKRPWIPSHYVSYDGVQRWFRNNSFPTRKRINRFWNQYFD